MTTAAAADRDLVGPYRLVKAIGAGGSARIDLARIDRAYGFHRHVVVKRPLEHLRDDPKAAASLRLEAKIGGRLRHPNLIGVLDAGTQGCYDYVVLEYVHGASLRALMQTDAGPHVRELPIGVALAIVVDTARGLHHAHELADELGAPLGLVHRDVSPGNVLVGFDGTVKLADFGIAKETRVATLSGSMHGTVTYMAPEQCRGHAFDRRADVFSLGVILYELVTGARLFWADNDVASLHRVLSGAVPRPRKINPKLDPALEDIVVTALAADPDRRYASAHAFAEAIEHYAASTGAMLTARSIAAWVEHVLGPRDAPWIDSTLRPAPPGTPSGSTTIPEPSCDEGSLVAIIAAAGDDSAVRIDLAASESFGPSDPVVDAPAVRPARRRGRILLASAIAAGLVGGIVAMMSAANRGDPDGLPGGASRSPGGSLGSDSAPPTAAGPDAALAPVARKPPPETPTATIPAAPAIASKPRSPETRRAPKPRPPSATPIATPAPAPPAPTPPPIAPTAPPIVDIVGRGSGSSTTPPHTPRPQWDPRLLLPTDSRASKKQR